MKYLIILSAFLFLSLWCVGVVSAVSNDAADIVTKMDTRYDGDSVIAEMTMILINNNDQKRVRKIKSFSKDSGFYTKGVVFFLSPADVKDTAYLSYDWNGERDDDSWLYLPALRNVKRISSADESRPFMGSDFSYADINGLDISDWSYRLVKISEFFEGQDTWVIEGKPQPEKFDKVVRETGYIKYKLWILKSNHMMVKGKYWVKKGKKIKYFTAGDISLVDNVWTASIMKMVTTKKGKKEHETTLTISTIHYNKELKDNFFTTDRISRGL